MNIPGYKYCGPFNRMDKGDPTNPVDAACYEHDIAYGKMGKKSYFYFNEADEKLIQNIDNMASNGEAIGFGGEITRGVFKLKRWIAPELSGLDKIRRVSNDNPFQDEKMCISNGVPQFGGVFDSETKLKRSAALAAIRSRAGEFKRRRVIDIYRPAKGIVYYHQGKHERANFKNFRMAYYARRRRRGRYGKRRHRRRRTVSNYYRNKRARYAYKRPTYRKKNYRKVKSMKVSKDIYRKIKFASFYQSPVAFEFSQASLFNIMSASAASTTCKDYSRWIFVPGYSGGAYTPATNWNGTALVTNFNTDCFDAIITKINTTTVGLLNVASDINRTFFYNFKVVHDIYNTGNVKCNVWVYKHVCLDYIASVNAMESAIQLLADTNYAALYPNKANYGVMTRIGAGNVGTVYVTQAGFNLNRIVELKRAWKTKLVGKLVLEPMKSFQLIEKHRPIEYNTRIWSSKCKRNVTWHYSIHIEMPFLETNDATKKTTQAFPNVVIKSKTTCKILQPAVTKDYIQTYQYEDSTNIGTAASGLIGQPGQGEIAPQG